MEDINLDLVTHHFVLYIAFDRKLLCRDEPPGQTYQIAIQELMTLSLNANRDPAVLQPYTEMKLNYDLEMNMQRLLDLKKAVYDMKCMEISNFEEQFEIVFDRNELENKKKMLQLKMSDEALSLYPEYTNAVALLKELGYIEHDERGWCCTIYFNKDH